LPKYTYYSYRQVWDKEYVNGHHSPGVEEHHKITDILLAKGQKKRKATEKVGDSIAVATDYVAKYYSGTVSSIC